VVDIVRPDSRARTFVPYAVVLPNWKMKLVALPCGLTVPFSVAALEETPVGRAGRRGCRLLLGENAGGTRRVGARATVRAWSTTAAVDVSGPRAAAVHEREAARAERPELVGDPTAAAAAAVATAAAGAAGTATCDRGAAVDVHRIA
jgi:hypothetical protein